MKSLLLAVVAVGCMACSAGELAFGPEKSLAEIRDAVRSARADRSPVTVVLKDGVYRIPETVAFGPEDAGVTYRAEHRGQVVLTGARDLAWRRPTAAEWDARPLKLVPQAARAALRVAEVPADVDLPGFFQGGCLLDCAKYMDWPILLFQGGDRLTLARAPDEGRFHETQFHGSCTTNAVMLQILYPLGTFDVRGEARRHVAAWAEEPDLWAWGLWCHKWSDARFAVTNVNAATGTLALDHRYWRFPFRNNQEYFVFNAFSEITRPGEWAVDRAKRLVAVWPKDGRELPVLAATPTLVRFEKTKDVVFSGCVFECARRTAVTGSKIENVAVESSLVRRTGGWGVSFSDATRCRVVGCDMEDLGEGGVNLAGGEINTLTPGGNVADNNHIHHYGRVIPNYRPGVSLNGVGNVATHNLIHHSDHQGLNFSGCDHRFAFNIVHDTCMHNDDAGALYCCQYDWWKVGTVIEYNLIHETGDHPLPVNCSATYFDDWSSGQTLRHNILSRGSRGVSMGGGQFTEVISNVIIRMKDAGIAFSSRGTNSFARHASIKGTNSSNYRKMMAMRPTLETPVWRQKHPELAQWFAFKDPYVVHDALFTTVKDNVSVCCGAPPMRYFNTVKAWNRWENNIDTDRNPGIRDYVKLDFNPDPRGKYADLVAACRFSEMGLYADAKRFSPAVRYGAGVTYPKALARLRDAPDVRIDIHLNALPEGEPVIAKDCRNCGLPVWAKGRRVVAQFGRPGDDWRDYSFSFTPAVTGTYRFAFMGLHGDFTDYGDLTVTGGRYEGPAKVSASHDAIVNANLHVTKDVPVKIAFRARRHPDGELLPATADANRPHNTHRRAEEVKVRDGIGNTMQKLAAGQDVTVAYIGGSITCGDHSWRAKTTAGLRKAYPNAKISEIHAAIGGTDSSLGVFRYDEDVLAKNPDLVLIEFACNDSGCKNPVIRRSIEGMVRKTWQCDPAIDIAFAYVICSYMTNDYCRGFYPRAASVHEEIAERYGIPSVCFGVRVANLCRKNQIVMRAMELSEKDRKASEKMVFPTEGDFEGKSAPKGAKPIFSYDGVHPTPDGQQLYANCMRDAFAVFAKKAPVPHGERLGSPLFDGGYERAKWFVPPERLLKGAGWRPFAIPEKEKKLLKWSWMTGNTDPLVRTDRVGDRISFRFRGTRLGLYGLFGPDGSMLDVAIDGQPRKNPVCLFDMYCCRYRFCPVILFDGADGEHTVEITLTNRAFDKTKYGAPRITAETLKDPVYGGNALYVSRLMLLGELL